MTIAIDGRALQGAYGGIDVYTHLLIEHLLKNDDTHRYILFFNSYRSVQQPYTWDGNRLRTVQTHIPSKLMNSALMAFGQPKIDRLIEQAAREPIDLFFMPNMNFASFSKHARIIVTVHDVSYVHFSRCQPLKGKLWHAAVAPQKLFMRADKIIAVSQSCKNDVISTFGIDPGHITVIPLGIEQQFHTEMQYRGHLPIILAFCPQERRKNIEALIEAYALARMRSGRIRESTLVLAGVVSIPKRIKHVINRLELQQSIKIVPYLSLNRRRQLLLSARICVYPSLYEGFGLPPLEACAAGIPVIAGAHSSIPRVSGAGVWYCDPYNIASICDSLIAVYSNEVLRSDMEARGKEHAQRYDWNKTAQQTLHVFNSI